MSTTKKKITPALVAQLKLDGLGRSEIAERLGVEPLELSPYLYGRKKELTEAEMARLKKEKRASRAVADDEVPETPTTAALQAETDENTLDQIREVVDLKTLPMQKKIELVRTLLHA